MYFPLLIQQYILKFDISIDITYELYICYGNIKYFLLFMKKLILLIVIIFFYLALISDIHASSYHLYNPLLGKPNYMT